ncbi:MAG: GNAT family protein [Bacteroidota bacterium]
MQIEFRILRAHDIQLYREIRLDCLQKFPGNFGTLYEHEVKSKTLKFDKVLVQENAPSFLYGAFQKEKLLGICGFSRENRIKTNHRGIISQMYVRTEFAGKGIGKHLLKLTIDQALKDHKLEQIELGVVSDNVKAIQLYSSVGFTQFGYYEKYFKHNNKYQALICMSITRENYFNKCTMGFINPLNDE